ncbi:hypothetical protein TRFO_27780 [Tritrichomonas foetus]|uniref:DNA-directed RNA polymerase III subunit RPC9 n=1 Tax=Tritrichomonas foetus TaxID=1144522 RepID=A0A1J4K088_9EUKA|nr:hypothetical protein TRFO_27780 [Tritrichomonas foetus]|eukprot:OHT04643.1 hypothetical protein TRFO_27780 [Tritrichomonas foetus]
MEIVETNHAVMTAYEVLRVVKMRQKAAKPYRDSRDKEYLNDYNRIREAREHVIPSLLAHCPEGTLEDGNDGIDAKIPEFCERIQELNSKITPFQIRNILSVRPRNTCELACLFPTEEEWGTISAHSDMIIDLVNEIFPIEFDPILDSDNDTRKQEPASDGSD